MEYKSTNVQWYGNINKLAFLLVLLSIPIVLLGVFLWWQFLAVKIVVFIFAGLIMLGVFIILIKWIIKLSGIHIPSRTPSKPYKNPKTNKVIYTDRKGRKYYKVYI